MINWRPASPGAHLMNYRSGTTALILTLTMIGASTWSLAAEPATPLGCAAVALDVDRLKCYDALFRRAPQTPEEQSAAIARDFGAASKRPGQATRGAEGPNRIQAPLANGVELRNGRWRLELENGQIWETIESADGRLPQAGASISIRKASLGSFLLSVDDRAGLRARRIR